MFWVYVIKSQKFNWYYVGLTANIKKRISQHNNKKVRSSQFYAPFYLVQSKVFESRLEARDYEKYLKIRSNKERLIRSLA